MLNQQHRFAQRIIDRGDRKIYQMHMCGLCHSLGDNYGLMSRLITNHEMILLNMLTNAQNEEDIEVVQRRCPLNPLMKVATNRNSASQFSGAVAVELANVSVDDDLTDSDGRDLKARVLNSVLSTPHQKALEILKDLDFNTTILTQLDAQQSLAAQDDSQDSALPSAQASAELFATTSRLAGNSANEEILAEIGASYGVYLYLLDAYRDYKKDMERNEYNPLRRFTIEQDGTFVLSHAGLIWLLGQFKKIDNALQRNVTQLQLHRYHDAASKLLREPIKKIISEVSAKTTAETNLVFNRWRMADALRAATFALPISASVGTAAAALCVLSPFIFATSDNCCDCSGVDCDPGDCCVGCGAGCDGCLD